MPQTSRRHPPPALLLVASDSITGNGFFFNPLPWMMLVGVMLLFSVLLWIPFVRNITTPLARMTLAAEEIARGRFDLPLHEDRLDEIGRLAKAIHHMTSRLSAFVTGQKRFLGDVAHELASPIARIQMGLGVLAHRTTGENQERVQDVMEDVDQLFEPFFRPEPSRDRASGGVGLGLAIVKTCIEACRGTVVACNGTPNGFTVIITLEQAS